MFQKYFLLLPFVILMIAARGQADPNFHLYLLAGQSNMAGRGLPDSLSKVIDPAILMLDRHNNWVPATDPVHFDKPAMAGVGPAISFARAMIAAHPNIKIGLIPCAWGGSPIRVWEQDSVYLDTVMPYNFSLERAKAAMKQGVLKGILWHQGESDNNEKAAAIYLPKLSDLIRRYRQDLNSPQLPFVAGEIGYFNTTTVINSSMDSLPLLVPHTAVVSAAGLEHKGDKLHFDTPSARILGARYAAAMLKLQQQ